MTAASRKAPPVLALLPALALALLVFGRAVRFPFVNWDDPSHFSDNPLAVHPLARGWQGLFFTREIGYPAPLLQLSFALDMALFGRHPGPWHAENVALHLVNVTLFFVLVQRMGLGRRAAGVAAALFAVHPLVVEPVCWVTGRKDVLSVALVLGACLLVSRGGAARPALRWVGANALCMLAVLVLPRMVAAAPFVAVVAHSSRFETRPARLAARLVPTLALGAVIVVLGTRQLGALGGLPPPRSPGAIVADVAAAWALQLGHVFWPVDLLAYYFRAPGDPSLLWMVLAAMCAVALAVLAWSSEPRSPERVGALLGLVAYGPVSCVLAINRWTADSYMYLPLMGLICCLVPAVARRWPERLSRFGLGATWLGVAVFALLALTYTSRWSSSTEVWRGGVDRYPDVALALEHEALGLVADGRMAEANPMFLRMAERYPDWSDTFTDEVVAYEAAGDAASATRILLRGVRQGEPGCVRMFWMRVVYAPSSLGRLDRAVTAIAFDRGRSEMFERLHDPAALVRIAAALRSVGLDDDAARVDEHLAGLKGGG